MGAPIRAQGDQRRTLEHAHGGRGRLFFFSSRRRHTRCLSDWSSDVCSSDLRYLPAVSFTLHLPPCGWPPAHGAGPRKLGFTSACHSMTSFCCGFRISLSGWSGEGITRIVLPQPDWTTAPIPKLIVSIHSFVFLRSIENSSFVSDGWRAPGARFARCAGGTGSQPALLSDREPVPHPLWKVRGRDSRAPAAAPLRCVPAGPAPGPSPIVPAGWCPPFPRRFGGHQPAGTIGEGPGAG